MSYLVLYLLTAAIFLALDVVMLRTVMAPLFERHVPDLLTPAPKLIPAAIFYLLYVAGLVYLVSAPALKSGGPVLITAAIIGAMAYGTYEFTNLATLKGWHPAMVATDLIWGTCLTAFSCWAGLTLTRHFTA